MPDELAKLLELADKPAPTGQLDGAKVEQLDAEPRVVRRHLQLRAGQRSEILASAVYPQLPVLVYAAGQLSGQTYDDAQGVFAVKSFPQPDGRVRLELVPELHYGQPRQRWVGSQGMLRLETGRAKQVYDDMTLTADLSPGAMLVLSSLPNRPGSLGHHFFTQSDGAAGAEAAGDPARADAARRAVRPAGAAEAGGVGVREHQTRDFGLRRWEEWE